MKNASPIVLALSLIAASALLLAREPAAFSQNLVDESSSASFSATSYDMVSPTASPSETPSPIPIEVEVLGAAYASPTSFPYSLTLSGPESGSEILLTPQVLSSPAPTDSGSSFISTNIPAAEASATPLPLCSYSCNSQGTWDIVVPAGGKCDSTILSTLPVPCPTPYLVPATPTVTPTAAPTKKPTPKPNSLPGPFDPGGYGGGIGPSC